MHHDRTSHRRLGKRTREVGPTFERGSLLRVRSVAASHPKLRAVPSKGRLTRPQPKSVRLGLLYFERNASHFTNSRSHVVLTSYEVVTSKDFKYFKQVPRWETLIVEYVLGPHGVGMRTDSVPKPPFSEGQRRACRC